MIVTFTCTGTSGRGARATPAAVGAVPSGDDSACLSAVVTRSWGASRRPVVQAVTSRSWRSSWSTVRRSPWPRYQRAEASSAAIAPASPSAGPDAHNVAPPSVPSAPLPFLNNHTRRSRTTSVRRSSAAAGSTAITARSTAFSNRPIVNPTTAGTSTSASTRVASCGVRCRVLATRASILRHSRSPRRASPVVRGNRPATSSVTAASTRRPAAPSVATIVAAVSATTIASWVACADTSRRRRRRSSSSCSASGSQSSYIPAIASRPANTARFSARRATSNARENRSTDTSAVRAGDGHADDAFSEAARAGRPAVPPAGVVSPSRPMDKILPNSNTCSIESHPLRTNTSG